MITSTYDALKALKASGSTYGYSDFLLCEIGTNGREVLSASNTIASWPKTIEHPLRCVASTEAVSRRLASSTLPFRFRPGASVIEDIWNNVRKQGQQEPHILALPLISPIGNRYVMFFRLEHQTSTWSEIADLYQASLEILQALFEISTGSRLPRNGPLLSEREITVLQLAADGHSSKEMATLMNLSEHTINHHINTACDALGASNRPNLFAKAFRLGLIN